MNVLTINQNTNFQGKAIAKGKKWTPELKQAFENCEYLKNFMDGYNIVGRISTRKASGKNIAHEKGQTLYRIKMSLVKESSKLAEFLDRLHLLKRVKLTQSYHSEQGNLDKILFFMTHVKQSARFLKSVLHQ